MLEINGNKQCNGILYGSDVESKDFIGFFHEFNVDYRIMRFSILYTPTMNMILGTK